MAAAHALSKALTLGLGAVVIAGLLDYLLRFQDRGIRVIISMALLSAIVWVFWRYFVPTLRLRLAETDVALCVQRRFPELGDQLLSAVELLRYDRNDLTAGSAALRQAAIAHTVAISDALRFTAVLDPRPTIKAVAALVVMCLLIAILWLLEPVIGTIALTRLVNPLEETAWPRTTHLAILQPVNKVALGHDFQVEVIDARHARLPRELRVYYRFTGPDGAAIEETDLLAPNKGVAIVRRENVLRPFSYRVEGGDDQTMPWQEVQVVEPPGIASLDVQLVPPTYTGRPKELSTPQINAWAGTVVHLLGTATKPLRSATLCLSDGTQSPANLSADNSFTASFTIRESSSYWFNLIDEEGVSSGDNDHWDIHALPDSPPTVNIVEPASNLSSTPKATLPLHVTAVDDLALAEVAIVYRRPEATTDEKISLWSASGAPADGAKPRKTLHIDHYLQLEPLGLKPGEQLTFWVEAADFLPQSAKSEPRIITIVTPQEMKNRLAAREKLVQAELERALAMQRSCRAQIELLRERCEQSYVLKQTDCESLQALEHAQREVDRVLIGRGEGVLMHLAALLADMDNNRVSDDAVRSRLNDAAQTIEKLQRHQLLQAGNRLTTATKTAQLALDANDDSPRAGKELAAVLRDVIKNQDVVIQTLEDLLASLGRLEGLRRFPRELAQLLSDQEELLRRGTELGRRTLTQQPQELSRQDVSELNTLADRQLELGRSFDRLVQQMTTAGEELVYSDPAAAKILVEAVKLAGQSALSGQMRTVGGQIRQNQLGRALAGQQRICLDLRSVLDLFVARSDGQQADNSSAVRLPTDEPQKDGRPEGAAEGHEPGEAPTTPDKAESHADPQTAQLDPQAADAMMRRLWGELPETARQQMTQLPSEQFVPKYTKQTEQYFRRLATEKPSEGAHNDD